MVRSLHRQRCGSRHLLRCDRSQPRPCQPSLAFTRGRTGAVGESVQVTGATRLRVRRRLIARRETSVPLTPRCVGRFVGWKSKVRMAPNPIATTASMVRPHRRLKASGQEGRRVSASSCAMRWKILPAEGLVSRHPLALTPPATDKSRQRSLARTVDRHAEQEAIRSSYHRLPQLPGSTLFFKQIVDNR